MHGRAKERRTSRHESPAFRELVLQARPKLIVEVGTWKGASAIRLAEEVESAGLAAQILCIDTWLGALEFWTAQDDPERYQSLQLKHGWPQVFYQFMLPSSISTRRTRPACSAPAVGASRSGAEQRLIW